MPLKSTQSPYVGQQVFTSCCTVFVWQISVFWCRLSMTTSCCCLRSSCSRRHCMEIGEFRPFNRHLTDRAVAYRYLRSGPASWNSLPATVPVLSLFFSCSGSQLKTELFGTIWILWRTCIIAREHKSFY